ncbi:hypothetical protein [Streptomyces sp. NPDC057552]|uniref:hypothetical protein n=1 Tax=Streptomyces sp. NPDC057552 TaxID=3350537 RepID=UPI0036C2C339
MTGPGQGFDIVGLPMDTYVDSVDCADIKATAEVEAIAKLLEPWGGEPVPWETPRRTLSAVSARLGSWSRQGDPRNSVLLWVGHGNSNDQEAYLVVRGDETNDRDDELTPAAMARYLVDRFRTDDPYWVVVVVEACGAALFVDLLQAELLRRGAAERILLIGSGARQGKGYLAAFRAVLAKVIDDLNGNDSYIGLRDLGQRIEDLLLPGSVLAKGIGGARLVRTSPPVPPVTMTLDDLSRPGAAGTTAPTGPQAGPSTGPPASGLSAPGGELSRFFVGRAADRTAVTRWLEEHEHGLLAVSGPPGCGKSAFLADLLRRGPAGEPGADVALNLTGASMSQVVDSLAGQFGTEIPAWTVSDDPRVEDLLERIDRIDRAPERRTTMVVDALDAAVDPGRMAYLLRELAARPGIRVVVGTRPSATDGLDRPPSPVEDLLDALGRGEAGVTVHRLARDPQDLAEFVRHRLLSERPGFAGTGVDLGEAVARTAALIGAQTPVSGSERDFLHTVLVVHEIIARPELLEEEHRHGLAELVGRDHRSLFGAVVDRLEGVLPGSRAVLRALAFAQGRGLPRAERIWATVASALGGAPVDARLLADVAVAAGPYIMLDAEDGQAVYRLAHGAFREVLLDGPAPHGPATAHAEVTEALVRLTAAAEGEDTASWRPHPYLIRHLADHAAAGGARGWEALAASPGVLDLLDPAAVAGAVLRFGVRLGSLPQAVAGTLATAHLALLGTGADRRGLRELGMGGTVTEGPLPGPSGAAVPGHPGAATAGLPGVADAGSSESPVVRTVPGLPGAVEPGSCGAASPESPAVRTVPGLPGVADAGSCGAAPSESPAVRTAPRLSGVADAGSCGVAVPGPSGVAPSEPPGVASFEPSDAASPDLFRVADPEPSGTASPESPGIAAPGPSGAASPGPPAARTAPQPPARSTDAWSVRWAAMPSHVPHVVLARLRHPMRSVVPLYGASGRRLVVAAGDAGLVRAWDLGTGREALPPLRAAGTSAVQSALAALGPEGCQDLLAAAGEDGVLHRWDPGTGELLPGPVPLATGRATAMAPLGGVLAIGDGQGRIGWVDPGTGEAVHRPGIGHQGPVQGMAVYRAGPDADSERLVSVDAGGRVMVWRRGRRHPVRSWQADPVTVHGVAALVGPEGEPLVATAGEDGNVTLWDPESGTPVGDPLTGHEGAVNAVVPVTGPGAVTLLASGGKDGTLRIWNLFPDRSELLRLTGHRGPVNAVTGVAGPEGAVLLATAGQDRSVRLWDVRGPYAPRTGDSGPGQVRTLARMAVPGGRPVLAAGTGEGIVWRDLHDGRRRSGFPGVRGGGEVAMTAVRGTRGEEFLADVGEDGRIRVYDVLGVEDVREIRPPGSPYGEGPGFRLVAAAPEPDGTDLLAALTDSGELCLYDPRDGRPRSRTDTGLPGPFTAMAALPRRTRSAGFAIACRNGTEIQLFDPATARRFPWARGGTAGQVQALAVAGGTGGMRRVLVSGGSDGALDLWAPAGLRLLHTVRLGVRPRALADAGDGALAVGTQEGVLVLTLNPGLHTPGPGLLTLNPVPLSGG